MQLALSMETLVRDARHRIPVLWSLYRPLLRLSSHDELLQAHLRRAFKRTTKTTNLAHLQRNLLHNYQILDDLRRMKSKNDDRLSQQYATLSQHLAIQSAARPSPLPAKAIPRTIRTPGIIHSSALNPPWPRLKPQPEAMTMIIFRRRTAIQKRWDRLHATKELLQDSVLENAFLKRLGIEEDWTEVVRPYVGEIERAISRDTARSELRPDAKLVQGAISAHHKREKYRKQAAAKRKL